jgi:hypothetical protein
MIPNSPTAGTVEGLAHASPLSMTGQRGARGGPGPTSGTIYGYRERESGRIRYVGRTTADVRRRHDGHLHGRQKIDRYLRENTGELELVVLEENVHVDDLRDREDWWIHSQRVLGSRAGWGLNQSRSGGVLSHVARGLTSYRWHVEWKVSALRVKALNDDVDQLRGSAFHLSLYPGHPSYQRCDDANLVALFGVLDCAAQVEASVQQFAERTVADLLYRDETAVFDWVLEEIGVAYTRYVRFASPEEIRVAYGWQGRNAARRG